jgi:hypothetical protein
MPKADIVHSTPLTDAPVAPTRRRFLSQAAGAATVGGAALVLGDDPARAAAAAAPAPSVDPVFALIARHHAEHQAYDAALTAQSELHETVPSEVLRAARVQWGMKDGAPYYLHSHEQIDHRMEWSPDFASTPKIRARLHAELARDMSERSAKQAEHGMTDADDLVEQLCDSCQDLGWVLANTAPISVAGVAALLRYANEFEDDGQEWPDTDAIGSEGWHYQLRQTAAKALETALGGR